MNGTNARQTFQAHVAGTINQRIGSTEITVTIVTTTCAAIGFCVMTNTAVDTIVHRVAASIENIPDGYLL